MGIRCGAAVLVVALLAAGDGNGAATGNPAAHRPSQPPKRPPASHQQEQEEELRLSLSGMGVATRMAFPVVGPALAVFAEGVVVTLDALHVAEEAGEERMKARLIVITRRQESFRKLGKVHRFNANDVAYKAVVQQMTDDVTELNGQNARKFLVWSLTHGDGFLQAARAPVSAVFAHYLGKRLTALLPLGSRVSQDAIRLAPVRRDMTRATWKQSYHLTRLFARSAPLVRKLSDALLAESLYEHARSRDFWLAKKSPHGIAPQTPDSATTASGGGSAYCTSSSSLSTGGLSLGSTLCIPRAPRIDVKKNRPVFAAPPPHPTAVVPSTTPIPSPVGTGIAATPPVLAPPAIAPIPAPNPETVVSPGLSPSADPRPTIAEDEPDQQRPTPHRDEPLRFGDSPAERQARRISITGNWP